MKKYKLIQSGGNGKKDLDLNNLFSGYSGFGIDSSDLQKFKINDYPETYGEITENGLNQVLSNYDTKGKVFYDLEIVYFVK